MNKFIIGLVAAVFVRMIAVKRVEIGGKWKVAGILM
jgi:hypothetical protein